MPTAGWAELDDLDRKITALLIHDARLPSSQIARKLGVPEATVRDRIRRLKDQGRMATVTMPALSEGTLRATFFVRTVPGKTDELIDELKGLESLVYLAIGSGTFDVFCHGVFRDEDEFLQFRNRTLGGS